MRIQVLAKTLLFLLFTTEIEKRRGWLFGLGRNARKPVDGRSPKGVSTPGVRSSIESAR